MNHAIYLSKKIRIKQRSNKIQIIFHKIYGIGIRQSTVGTVVKKNNCIR